MVDFASPKLMFSYQFLKLQWFSSSRAITKVLAVHEATTAHQLVNQAVTAYQLRIIPKL